eukprot:TRINITY_DN33486_c0_g1_i2.p1 TRINITY_DN33486_c0_g1~~TRINITY_DN33486_c0_g1_i2.p1  ORF type:complete len:290 (+),score=15.09 TRINITY_DN33486_c0_g1_i2:108-977(+)
MEWTDFAVVCDGVAATTISRRGEVATWDALAWRRPLQLRSNSAASLRREVGQLKRRGQWTTQGSRPSSAPANSRKQLQHTEAPDDVIGLCHTHNLLQAHQTRRSAHLSTLGQNPSEHTCAELQDTRTGFADAEVSNDVWYPLEVPKQPPASQGTRHRPRSAPCVSRRSGGEDAAFQHLPPHRRLQCRANELRAATLHEWFSDAAVEDQSVESKRRPSVRPTRASAGRELMRRGKQPRSDFECGRARGRQFTFGSCKGKPCHATGDQFTALGFELKGTGLGIGERCTDPK